MNEPRHFNNQDRVQLGCDLERLTDRYEREGYDPHGLHFELTVMAIGWLLYNGVTADSLVEGVEESFVALIEEKRQAESTQDTLQ